MIEGKDRRIAGEDHVRPIGVARQVDRLEPVGELVSRQADHAPLERGAVGTIGIMRANEPAQPPEPAIRIRRADRFHPVGIPAEVGPAPPALALRQ